jgi:hypothetical protein
MSFSGRVDPPRHVWVASQYDPGRTHRCARCGLTRYTYPNERHVFQPKHRRRFLEGATPECVRGQGLPVTR